jgi:predicted metal-dependent peptidase
LNHAIETTNNLKGDTVMTTNAMDKMVKCRTALIIDQRFIGALALRLQLVEDATCKTMWTDGVSLGFNPALVMSMTMDECKGMIAHEVWHCALGHHLRRNGRDNSVWNEACDYAINPVLIDSGFKLKEGMINCAEFKDQSADQIFHTLNGRKPKPQEDADQDQGDKGEKGDEQGEGTEGEENSDSGTEESDNGTDGDGSGQPDPNGKGGKGKGKPEPDADPDPNGGGEIRDYPGESGTATETEKAQNEQEWKIALASAAQTAVGCGQMTGGLQRIVTTVLDSKVPWTQVLQRFVDQISHNDYSYARTNARYAAHGVIMPSLYDKTLPPIDIMLDTSGSCFSDEEQKQFLAEINDIRSHYKTTIRIIFCDDDFQDVQIVERDEDLTEFNIKGGGGTSFAPAIAWSQNHEEQPVCAVYLTDMDCDDFGPEPDFPVLWIQVKGREARPPFGELVMMHPPKY